MDTHDYLQRVMTIAKLSPCVGLTLGPKIGRRYSSWTDPETLYKNRGDVKFYMLKDAWAAVLDADNFVYDRTAGVVICNLESGRHEEFTATLVNCYKHKFQSCLSEYYLSEMFYKHKLGVVKSSCSSPILIGTDDSLHGEEIAVFESFRMLRL